MTLQPQDEERFRQLVTHLAREVATELPEATRDEVVDRVTRLVIADLRRLADAGDAWAQRVLRTVMEGRGT